jgi:phage shock protein A
MFSRIWRYLKALFLGKLGEVEDPEVLLEEAKREMRENLAANRQRAITAVTSKNNLKAMLDEQEKRIANLDAESQMAVKNGDRDLARQVLREKLTLEAGLTGTQASYDQACKVAETVKEAIHRQEEVVRQRTAEALAKKAQWKQSQIQIEIDKALDGLTLQDDSSAWNRASEKITTAQSEAAARTEIGESSLESKIADLQDDTIDVDAEKALQELEQKMGVSTPQATEQTTQPVSEVEKELAEIETKVVTNTP